ncbi:Nitrilase [Wickerhamomyces ciferrii]|uniref:Nitrilase n=1 Tax=Wickerhamomyces ciferrii (strain ATCC 14091 / BCRC 22168 / CBS 111 / JCM 3599 / NBRC 0793 / NRRL Y-1031 F-60-10) TaxID=1206466 RepID=K0KXT5_WICCF|nr:Nitrilase [Wickerhamomyces ciferrii]CCH46862.1 Nitrilase [Wickerhamomyces ciferrii]
MVLVAAGQLNSSSSLIENGQTVVKLISKAVELGIKILFLPEASDYLAKNASHSKKLVKSIDESPFVLEIQKKLQDLHSKGIFININVGIHEPSPNSDRTQNTSIWFNEKGEITQRYQKIHLFDVDVANGPILRESESVEPGSQVLPPFDTIAGKVALGICYDIRFPELALRQRSLGAQILTFPSAFTVRTGAAHWHLLGRSRAIDTQSYVIMAAQSGPHNTPDEEDLANGTDFKPTRISYGHSLIIDPWGTIIAETSDIDVGKTALAIADIDLDQLEIVRKNMPLWSQRRSDVFGYDV